MHLQTKHQNQVLFYIQNLCCVAKQRQILEDLIGCKFSSRKDAFQFGVGCPRPRSLLLQYVAFLNRGDEEFLQ